MSTQPVNMETGEVKEPAILHTWQKSDHIGQLISALSLAQGQIEGAAKSSANPFFKSKYADLASCWDACREPLSKNGLAIVQMPSADGAKLSVTTLLAHSSGEWLSETFTTHAKDSTPQSIGSATSYLRRYALAAFVGLYQVDDDAEGAQKGHEKKPLHQEGFEHPSDNCDVCLAAGVPEGYSCVQTKGHYYVRRLSDKKTPPHEVTFSGLPSSKYCPGCRNHKGSSEPTKLEPDAGAVRVISAPDFIADPAQSPSLPVVGIAAESPRHNGGSDPLPPPPQVSPASLNEVRDTTPAGEKGASSSVGAPLCPACEVPMTFRKAGKKTNGKPYPAFWGCPNYRRAPNPCKNTISDSDWKAGGNSEGEAGQLQALQAQVMKQFGLSLPEVKDFCAVNGAKPNETISFLDLALALGREVTTATEVKEAAKVNFDELHTYLEIHFPREQWLKNLQANNVPASKMGEVIREGLRPKQAPVEDLDTIPF